jgi:hypothetical protein
MFNFRQSSLPVGKPVAELSCAQESGMVVKFSVAGAQADAGWGGFHRRLPVGAAAKGTPRNAHELPRSAPWAPPTLVAAKQDALCVWTPSVETATAAPHIMMNPAICVNRFIWPPAWRRSARKIGAPRAAVFGKP